VLGLNFERRQPHSSNHPPLHLSKNARTYEYNHHPRVAHAVELRGLNRGVTYQEAS